jgi:predicted kinase
MKKIYLIGISGSGKSTICEEFIKANPEYVRLNRDAIREALIPNHNDIWYTASYTGQRQINEGLISKLLSSIEGNNKFVIDDNTNLNEKFLTQDFKKNKHRDLEVWVVMDSFDLSLCTERDLNRDRTVGKKIIEKQYNSFISLINNLSLLKEEFNLTIKEV